MNPNKLKTPNASPPVPLPEDELKQFVVCFCNNLLTPGGGGGAADSCRYYQPPFKSVFYWSIDCLDE